MDKCINQISSTKRKSDICDNEHQTKKKCDKKLQNVQISKSETEVPPQLAKDTLSNSDCIDSSRIPLQQYTPSALPDISNRGMTFCRVNTPIALNMVPAVSALFQAAAQHYSAFGFYPQYNPWMHDLQKATYAASQPPTLLQCHSGPLQYSSSSTSRQFGPATSAGNPVGVKISKFSNDVIGYPRQWEYTKYGRDHRHRERTGSEMSVMSYNILAQDLLEQHAYLYEGRNNNLSWNYRSKQLIREIAHHHSDIICLQEVQSNHYHDSINPELQKLGYDGVYQKRTGDKCDGCAIFFKHDKFTLLKSHVIKFNRGGLLDRDNIAVILELRPKSRFYNGSVEKLCVATTHLLFNPRRGDVKIGQLMVLFAELDKFARCSDGTYVPIILCGDFNIEPHSHLYNMICHGHLRYEGLNCKDVSGQKEGYYGGDAYLKSDVFSSLNITDHCQYVVSTEKETKQDNDKPAETSPFSSVINNSQPTGSEDKSWEKVKYKENIGSKYNTKTVRSGHLKHDLNFVSSYNHYIQRLKYKTPEVTTRHKRAACTVDYIFYNVHNKKLRKLHHGGEAIENIQEGKLMLLARYGLMSCREIDEFGVMPNKTMSSDHLPLIVRFLLKL